MPRGDAAVLGLIALLPALLFGLLWSLHDQLDIERVQTVVFCLAVALSTTIFLTIYQSAVGQSIEPEKHYNEGANPRLDKIGLLEGSSQMDLEGLVYDPLEDDQIRLLKLLQEEDNGTNVLRLQLFHAHLSQRPEYAALSYSWNQPSKGDGEKVMVNNRVVSVTQNLADALRMLQEKRILIVWADAVCINQHDNKEKSREITRIFAIYRMATTVALWLGSDTGAMKDINALLAMIEPSETTSPSKHGRVIHDSSLGINASHALDRLLSQPYWRRVWIIQEVAAAKKARIFWGSFSFDFGAVESLVRENSQYFDRVERLSGPALGVLSVRLACRSTTKRSGLMDILAMTSASQTSLLRDKVYGLLGLAPDWTHFVLTPNYSKDVSERELSLQMTSTHIDWNSSADIIFLRSTSAQQEELPSWCPDYFHFQLDEADKNLIAYVSHQDANLGWERRRAFSDPENVPSVTPDTIRVAGTKLTLKGNRIGQISVLGHTLNEGSVVPDASKIQNKDQNQGIVLPEAGKAFRRLLLLCHNQTFIRQDPSAFFSLLYALPEHVFRDNECMSVKRWLDVHKSFFEAFGLNVTVSSTADDDYDNNKNYAFIRSRNGGLSMSSTVILPEWKEYLNVNASVSSSNDGASNSMRRGKDSLQSILLSIASILQENQRLMFLGDESLLGWAHRDAEIGDTVWHLEGCTLQAILRRSAALSDESATGEDIYQLVGHAYVDSVMASGRWITKSKRRTVRLC